MDSDEIPRDVDEESSSEESDEYSDSEEKDEDGQLTDDDLDEHAHHEDKQSTLYYVLEKVKDVILLPVYIIHSGITYMFTREPQGKKFLIKKSRLRNIFFPPQFVRAKFTFKVPLLPNIL